MRPVPGRHDIVEQMSQSLKLDAQQKEKLKAIIQQSGERYSALSTQFRPQYDRIRAETNEAIRAVLRPDQRKLFEETLEKLDRRPRTRQRH
jgi:Spy/CpxP family protein refolding chaperone